MKFTVEYFDHINGGGWESLESFQTLEDAYAEINYYQNEDLENDQEYKYRILGGHVIFETE